MSKSGLDLTDGVRSGKDFLLLKKQLTSDPFGCRVLPVREILALTPNMQHYNWHSAVEKEGNSSVNPDEEKTFVFSSPSIGFHVASWVKRRHPFLESETLIRKDTT